MLLFKMCDKTGKIFAGRKCFMLEWSNCKFDHFTSYKKCQNFTVILMELCSTERDYDVTLKTVNQEVVIKNTVFLWSHHFLQKTQKFTVTLIEICSTEYLALKTVNQEVVKKDTVFSKDITSYKKWQRFTVMFTKNW